MAALAGFRWPRQQRESRKQKMRGRGVQGAMWREQDGGVEGGKWQRKVGARLPPEAAGTPAHPALGEDGFAEGPRPAHEQCRAPVLGWGVGGIWAINLQGTPWWRSSSQTLLKGPSRQTTQAALGVAGSLLSPRVPRVHRAQETQRLGQGQGQPVPWDAVR